MAEPRWVTFDCFGTLVDWRHGIAGTMDLLFPGHGSRLLDIYNRHEPTVQREFPGLRYRAVLAETLRRTAHEGGMPLREVDAGILGDTIPYWPVFPEVPEALSELRESGWRLALLTNCDQDIIGETQRRLGVPIDTVVTAEMVGAYKPDHAHFTRFADAFGASRGNWVHVAQSYFHDMVPAHALGLPKVWINRLGEPDPASVVELTRSDLHGVAAEVDRAHRAAR